MKHATRKTRKQIIKAQQERATRTAKEYAKAYKLKEVVQ